MTKPNAVSESSQSLQAGRRDENLLAPLAVDRLTPGQPVTPAALKGGGRLASRKAGKVKPATASDVTTTQSPLASRAVRPRPKAETRALHAQQGYLAVPTVPPLPQVKSRDATQVSPDGYRTVPTVSPLPKVKSRDATRVSPTLDGYRSVPSVSPLPEVKSRDGTRVSPALDGYRTVPSVSPLPKLPLPSATPAGVGQKTNAVTAPTQTEIDRSAIETLARANPLTEQINKAVKDFYRVAGGGRAARAHHVMAGSLRTVTELRRQLADVIADSNPLVAASSANHPTLDKQRSSLIQCRKAIDVWLKNANAYAAGLTGPGGDHTVTPALARPPSVVLSSPVSGLNATQEAAEIQHLYEGANAVISPA